MSERPETSTYTFRCPNCTKDVQFAITRWMCGTWKRVQCQFCSYIFHKWIDFWWWEQRKDWLASKVG